MEGKRKIIGRKRKLSEDSEIDENPTTSAKISRKPIRSNGQLAKAVLEIPNEIWLKIFQMTSNQFGCFPTIVW